MKNGSQFGPERWEKQIASEDVGAYPGGDA